MHMDFRFMDLNQAELKEFGSQVLLNYFPGLDINSSLPLSLLLFTDAQ